MVSLTSHHYDTTSQNGLQSNWGCGGERLKLPVDAVGQWFLLKQNTTVNGFIDVIPR